MQSLVAVLLWLVFSSPVAEPLPDQVWLEGVSLLAHSVRDQTVVITLPDGDHHLLGAGQKLPGRYDLTLLKVLNSRIELGATRAGVSDRKLKIWFVPGRPGVQIVSSQPKPPPGNIGPAHSSGAGVLKQEPG